MGNNLGGSYQTTDENIFKAYDALPHDIRVALQNSVENWVPQPVRTAFERKGKKRLDCIRMIRRWDKKELAKRERQRAKAIGPYKGNIPDEHSAGKKRPLAERSN